MTKVPELSRPWVNPRRIDIMKKAENKSLSVGERLDAIVQILKESGIIVDEEGIAQLEAIGMVDHEEPQE